MEIKLIGKRKYNKLKNIYNKYPCLTLQNKGYEGIDRREFNEKEKEADKQVNEILKEHIKDFSYFQNFKVRNNGDIAIRFQYHYSPSFTGVGYILIDELLNGFNQ